jgi:PrcB C-terminal
MSIRVALVVSLSLVAGAACTAVTTPPNGRAPELLGVCCPRTDAEIIALLRQYENTPEAARSAELAVVPYRFYSGLTERERIVVRDQESWAALWTRIVAPYLSPPARPAVDFDDEMLVVVSMGGRPSGGYAIYIDGLSVVRGNLLVVTREVTPGRGCVVTGAFTEPLALARLERSDLPVSFTTRSVIRDC